MWNNKILKFPTINTISQNCLSMKTPNYWSINTWKYEEEENIQNCVNKETVKIKNCEKPWLWK